MQNIHWCFTSCDPPCFGGSFCHNSQCICQDGFKFLGVPGNGECVRQTTPTPPPHGQCSQSCTGGATCQYTSGKWECACPPGLTYSNGWCVDKEQCTEPCKCHGSCNSDQDCGGGSTCQKVDGHWNCVCRKGFYCDGGTCHVITTTVTNQTPTTIPTSAPSPQGQCPPATKETSISKDISLDGGWVKINCEVCIIHLHNMVCLHAFESIRTYVKKIRLENKN